MGSSIKVFGKFTKRRERTSFGEGQEGLTAEAETYRVQMSGGRRTGPADTPHSDREVPGPVHPRRSGKVSMTYLLESSGVSPATVKWYVPLPLLYPVRGEWLRQFFHVRRGFSVIYTIRLCAVRRTYNPVKSIYNYGLKRLPVLISLFLRRSERRST